MPSRFVSFRRSHALQSISDWRAATYHSAEERGVDGAKLGVDLGWIHLVDNVFLWVFGRGECRSSGIQRGECRKQRMVMVDE